GAIVIADAAGVASFDKHRATVERDGSFTVAFAPDCKFGHLRLYAPYAYLATDASWKEGQPTQGIVLEPKLGAALRGRFTLPENARNLRSEIVGKSGQLDGVPLQPGMNGIARSGLID